MAIKGITEVQRLPRMGKIRLGVKKKSPKSGAEYPEKTDHFVLDPTDEAVLEEAVLVYGDKPKALDIIFPIDDPELVFPQFLKRYSFGSLICMGDGVQGAETLFAKDGNRTGDKAVKCEGCPYRESKKCKPMASLQFLLPKVPGLGVWQMDTSSYHSIVNINAGLRLVQTIYKRISGIPLRLILSPKTVSVEGRSKTVYIVSLSIEGTLQNAMQQNAVGAFAGKDEPRSLMPALDETHEDHFLKDDSGEIDDADDSENEFAAEVKEASDGASARSENTEAEKEVAIFDDPDELVAFLPAPAARKLLGERLLQIGYAPQKMSEYIQARFNKESTRFMSEKELNTAILHLGAIIELLNVGAKSFTRAEMDAYVQNFYKRDTMLMMDDEEIASYKRLLARSSGGKK